MIESYTPADILNNTELQYEIVKHYNLVIRVYEQCLCSQHKYIQLNKQLLFEAVGSCYCDIYRLKVFRNIQHEDAHKRAAFLMKWISKVQPIQIVQPTNKTSVMLSNSMLAVAVAIFIMDIKFTTSPVKLELRKYADNLVYLLHFHQCEPEQLASELFLLDKLSHVFLNN
jgi:hypothetical protein